MSCSQRYAGDHLAEQWTSATLPSDPTPAGYTAWNTTGVVTAQRALTGIEAATLAAQDDARMSGANRGQIVDRAQTALTVNDTYLALPAPTQAQALTQVAVLTREVNAVLRLILGQVSAVSDT